MLLGSHLMKTCLGILCNFLLVRWWPAFAPIPCNCFLFVCFLILQEETIHDGKYAHCMCPRKVRVLVCMHKTKNAGICLEVVTKDGIWTTPLSEPLTNRTHCIRLTVFIMIPDFSGMEHTACGVHTYVVLLQVFVIQ